MNQQTHSPESIPHASLDIQLRFDSKEGSISLSVNGVPVSIGSGDSGGIGQDAGRTSNRQLADRPVSTITPPIQAAPPAPQSLNDRWNNFRCNAEGYCLFLRLTRQALSILALIGLLQFALYQQFFTQEPRFLADYGWWIFYMDISVVSLAVVLGYLHAYPLNATPHMLSMMISMVIGMQAGTMIGAPLGATNGLFVGALTGMFFGAISGIYVGCRCGSMMAITQGLMSGGMSGTMGAMLIAMMPSNFVLSFMSVFTLVNLMILMGFTYLFYEEAVEGGHCRIRRTPGFKALSGVSFLVTILLVLLMIYGHKGPMTWAIKIATPSMNMGMGMGSME